MKITQQPNALAKYLQDFFSNYLTRLRGLSSHSIKNYRDCLVLLLRYIAEQKQCAVTDLNLSDFTSEKIIAFLQMLEDVRHNSASTRNIRLATIHVFFRYAAGRDPERLEQCQKILAIPFKRTNTQIVEYLEYEEIQAVLSAVDRSNQDGRRNYILLITMFNTGARVQEILNIRLRDLQLIKPYQVRLLGKGRKERICPLWMKTAKLLKEMIGERNDIAPGDPIFLNHQNRPMTRFGVRYVLAKYCEIAKKYAPTLTNKKLHPHSMRHSTAVHLLKSGVDIVTISHWLGHSNINTTNRYMSVDLDLKRDAINKIKIDNIDSTSETSWSSDPSILRWLVSL